MKPSKLSPLDAYYQDMEQALGLVRDSLRRHKDALGDLAHDYISRELDAITVPSKPKADDVVLPIAHNDNDAEEKKAHSPKMELTHALRQLHDHTRELLDDPMCVYADRPTIDSFCRDVVSAMMAMNGESRLQTVGR